MRGDDTSDNAPPTPGLTKVLDALLAGTSFGGGNVILGGRGGDMIEGRGGDDFIDGDASLTVSLTDTAAGGEINREITPVALRRKIERRHRGILRHSGQLTVTLDDSGVVTVAHLNGAGAGADGTDTLRHIEQLQPRSCLTGAARAGRISPAAAAIFRPEVRLMTPSFSTSLLRMTISLPTLLRGRTSRGSAASLTRRAGDGDDARDHRVRT